MLKLANTYNIEQLAGRTFFCECGKKHNIFTKEILFSPDALKQLPFVIEKRIKPKAKLLLVSDDKLFSLFGQELQSLLKACDFEVLTFIYPNDPEPSVAQADKLLTAERDIDALIAVGGGTIADIVKFACAKRKCPSIIYAVSLGTDAYLAPSAYLKAGGLWEIFCVPPPLVFAFDFKVISTQNYEQNAAAFGSIVSKLCALFDWFFSSKITGENYCKNIAELAYCEIERALTASNGLESHDWRKVLIISEAHMRLSLLMQAAGNSRLSCGAETHTAHALDMLFTFEKRQKKLYGENLFLAALLVNRLYLETAQIPQKQVFAPPDNTLRLDRICDFFGVAQSAALKKIHPHLDLAEQKIQDYKYFEYRNEFVTMLKSNQKKLSLALKSFKRAYPDSGFWLKNYIDRSDIRTAVALAPDIREKFSMLLYMKQCGMLEDYL